MVNEEILEGDRLIANFMKAEYKNSYYIFDTYPNICFDLTTNFHEKSLYYNTSWDWLIPVCHKIRDSKIYNSELTIENLSVFSSIDRVYLAVIEYIKWYNEYMKEHDNRQKQ